MLLWHFWLFQTCSAYTCKIYDYCSSSPPSNGLSNTCKPGSPTEWLLPSNLCQTLVAMTPDLSDSRLSLCSQSNLYSFCCKDYSTVQYSWLAVYTIFLASSSWFLVAVKLTGEMRPSPKERDAVQRSSKVTPDEQMESGAQFDTKKNPLRLWPL